MDQPLVGKQSVNADRRCRARIFVKGGHVFEEDGWDGVCGNQWGHSLALVPLHLDCDTEGVDGQEK